MSADLWRCCRALTQDRCQHHFRYHKRSAVRSEARRPAPAPVNHGRRTAAPGNGEPRGYSAALYIRQRSRIGSAPEPFNGSLSPDSVRGDRWWTAAPHVRRRNLIVKSPVPGHDPRLIAPGSHSSPDAIYIVVVSGSFVQSEHPRVWARHHAGTAARCRAGAIR